MGAGRRVWGEQCEQTYLSSHGEWSTLSQTDWSNGFKVGAWEVS